MNALYADDDSGNPKDEMGYDGQFIMDYGKICLSFISKFVGDEMILENPEFIMKKGSRSYDDNDSNEDDDEDRYY